MILVSTGHSQEGTVSMRVDSLKELQSAFAQWRKRKKHVREAMPETLLARARRCADRHGGGAVARAVGVDRSRLLRGWTPKKASGRTGEVRLQTVERAMPAFSLLELSAPSVSDGPVAEVETRDGVKLRLFKQTPEMLGLLSALCGIGGVR